MAKFICVSHEVLLNCDVAPQVFPTLNDAKVAICRQAVATQNLDLQLYLIGTIDDNEDQYVIDASCRELIFDVRSEYKMQGESND